MGAAFDSWVQQARGTPIERVIEQRGIKLKRVGVEHVGPCPKCGGDDRFAINVKKQVFNCRGCGAAGDVIGLVEALDGVDFTAACTTLAGQPPKKKANGHAKGNCKKIVVATFQYLDQNGGVAFAVERIQFQKADGAYVLKDGKPDKVFRQRRPDPDHPGQWIANKEGAPVVPYRLPQVIEAVSAGHPVFIVEGEAKADLLWSWNIAATCCAGGSKKWKPEHSQCLHGADVVLVPDHDNAGWEHANAVGTALADVAKRIRLLVLPHAKAKDDIIDWTKAGGTREQLDALLSEAQDWKPPTAEETSERIDKEKGEAKKREDELLDQLSNLKGLEFARERKKAADELDVPVTALDAEIKARREAAPLHGHWIVEPWPEPVDGDSLLRDIIMRLRRHVVCSLEDALTSALFAMFGWVHDEVATHSPILNINSAEPESGKSTLLGLLSFLLPRCVSSVEISEAALYRAIKLWQPSFVIDEFDSVLVSDDKAALRSVINSGHTRGTGVVRCIGDDRTPELFPTFCAKCIGMCGRRLPPATLSRCIFIELRRKKTSEKLERFEHKDDAGLADLRRRLLRFSMDNEETLRDAKPSMPAELENPRADNWRVLLAIADLCSGAEDWGDKARAAAVKIEGSSDARTVGARALTDAKLVFFPKGDRDQPLEPLERISSADLAAQFATYADSPWAEWKGGKPITQAQLARVLKPFGITPQLIRLSSGSVMRGYLRTQFEDAWERYA